MGIILLSACNEETLPVKLVYPNDAIIGDGTKEEPYDVASAIRKAKKETVSWVKGYIVGAVKKNVTEITDANDIVWGGQEINNQTLLLASNAEENDYTDFDVRLALLLHDIGKPFAYVEGPIRHYYNVSGASTKMAYVILKRFGYEEAFINKILYLIKNCNGIIDDDVIERNPVLAEKLYEVQYCDIMAQDTKYLKDRVDYLTTTNYKLKKRRSRLYKKR